MSGKKVRTCQVCGVDFEGKHSGRRGNLVCSHECRCEAVRLAKLRGAEVACHWCGVSRWRTPYEIKRSAKSFCSEDCRQAEFRSRSVALACEHCGVAFTRPRSQSVGARFCSNDCRHLAERSRVTIECRTCGKPFEIIPSYVGKVFSCSRECRAIYILTVVHPAMPRHNTKPERDFEAFASAWVRRTSDGKFFVNLPNGRIKNPDFVVLPFGSRKVVEVFGSYWHPAEEEATLTALYKEAGYECLVVWDYELKDGSFKDKFLRFLDC